MKNLTEKLKIEREKDKNDFARDISSLTTTISELVQTGVKEEIETAVKPLENKQKTMLDEQTKLVKKVSELEKRLESVAGNKTSNLSEQRATPNNIGDTINVPAEASKYDEEVEARRTEINFAKRILGFSKISDVHIKQAILEHDIDENDESKANIWTIFDFLYYEMKIPSDKIKEMKILRTFRPVKQPDSDRLYAEFSDIASVNLINLYVRNLQAGVNVDIWIPPSLFQRFRDFDRVNYQIRKGPGNFKAKIRYGETDFVLIKKSPTCHSWTTVVPDITLSPLEPSASFVPISSSPPMGRSSRSKRKTASPLNRSSSKSKASRIGPLEDLDDRDEASDAGTDAQDKDSLN